MKNRVKFFFMLALATLFTTSSFAVTVVTVKCELGTFFYDDIYGGSCYFNGNCYTITVREGDCPLVVTETNANDGTCQESGDYSIELGANECTENGITLEINNGGTLESHDILSFTQVLNQDGSRSFTFIPR